MSVGVEQLLPLQRRRRLGRRQRWLLLLLLHDFIGRGEAQRLRVHIFSGPGRQRIPRVPDDVRVAELGHAVYGVLFVLYPRGLVGLLLVPTPTVLHAQHHRDSGQHGHGHGHGQHDHEHAVDGRLHHFGLFQHGHALAVQVLGQHRPLVGTVGARVAGRTIAPKAVAAAAGRRARAAVGARRRRALVHVPAAVLTAEPGPAAAPEVVFQILARATVGARFGHAVVHLAQAQIAHVPGNALATETVGLRLARAAVLARVLLTLVG